MKTTSMLIHWCNLFSNINMSRAGTGKEEYLHDGYGAMVQALSSTYSITLLQTTTKLAGFLSENHDYMDPFKVAYYILMEVGQNHALVCLRKISSAYILYRRLI